MTLDNNMTLLPKEPTAQNIMLLYYQTGIQQSSKMKYLPISANKDPRTTYFSERFKSSKYKMLMIFN